MFGCFGVSITVVLQGILFIWLRCVPVLCRVVEVCAGDRVVSQDVEVRRSALGLSVAVDNVLVMQPFVNVTRIIGCEITRYLDTYSVVCCSNFIILGLLMSNRVSFWRNSTRDWRIDFNFQFETQLDPWRNLYSWRFGGGDVFRFRKVDQHILRSYL